MNIKMSKSALFIIGIEFTAGIIYSLIGYIPEGILCLLFCGIIFYDEIMIQKTEKLADLRMDAFECVIDRYYKEQLCKLLEGLQEIKSNELPDTDKNEIIPGDTRTESD